MKVGACAYCGSGPLTPDHSCMQMRAAKVAEYERRQGLGIDEAIEKASQVWCSDTCSHIQMDSRLAIDNLFVASNFITDLPLKE